MAHTTFHLQTLLDLRRNAEEEQKRLYAEAAYRRAAVEQQLKLLETQSAAARETIHEEQSRQNQQPAPGFISEGLTRIRYLERLSNLATQAEEAVHRFRAGAMTIALSEEEAARLTYAEARKELEVVRKLEEKERAFKQKRNLEREEAALEERAEAVFGKTDLTSKG